MISISRVASINNLASSVATGPFEFKTASLQPVSSRVAPRRALDLAIHREYNPLVGYMNKKIRVILQLILHLSNRKPC